MKQQEMMQQGARSIMGQGKRARGLLDEFKEFAMRGNMIDLAVGIIIGAAFGDVIKSLVNDVIMPPIGRLLGKVDFSNLYINLTSTHYDSLTAAKDAGAATLNYGAFITTVINFLIIALAVFLMIKQINRFLRKPPPPPAEPTTKDCPYCFSTIPIKATRCPDCTSQLEEAAPAPQ
jgi:large conductance mechanosensitive channel